MYENKNDHNTTKDTETLHTLRSRLYFTGDVNDNWQYVGMLQNEHNFTKDMQDGGQNQETADGEGTNFQRAYLQGRLGGTKITAGRWNQNLVGGLVYNTRVDGIQASYGKKINVTGYYVRPTNEYTTISTFDKSYGATVKAGLGKNFDVHAAYMKYADVSKNGGVFSDNLDIWNAGLGYTADTFALGFDWLKGKPAHEADTEGKTNNGWVISADIMGAKPAKVGSWGLSAKYHHQGVGTFVSPSIYYDDIAFKPYAATGFKGWSLEGNYTVAKNIIAGVDYFKMSQLDGDDKADASTLAGHLIFTF